MTALPANLAIVMRLGRTVYRVEPTTLTCHQLHDFQCSAIADVNDGDGIFLQLIQITCNA